MKSELGEGWYSFKWNGWSFSLEYAIGKIQEERTYGNDPKKYKG